MPDNVTRGAGQVERINPRQARQHLDADPNALLDDSREKFEQNHLEEPSPSKSSRTGRPRCRRMERSFSTAPDPAKPLLPVWQNGIKLRVSPTSRPLSAA
jgi:hypothetical protein